MRDWSPDRVAQAAGARLAAPAPHAAGPARVVIDSRDVGAGDLFVGLTGGRVDGGRFAPQALAAAEAGDVVVIAGKGHEQGQELAGGEKLPFDDVTVAREALRAAAEAAAR